MWAVTTTELISAPLPATASHRARRPAARVELMTARQRERSPSRARARGRRSSERPPTRLSPAPAGPALPAPVRGVERARGCSSSRRERWPTCRSACCPCPGRPGRRLADAHEVVYAPSASVVLALRREHPAGAAAADTGGRDRRSGVRSLGSARAEGCWVHPRPPGPPLAATALRRPCRRPCCAPRARWAGTAFARLPFSRLEAVAIAAETPAGTLLAAMDFSRVTRAG